MNVLICRDSMSHLLRDASKRAKLMRVITMPYLSPQLTTYLACTKPCVSLTKQKRCTRTSSGNILTMWTVSTLTSTVYNESKAPCKRMQHYGPYETTAATATGTSKSNGFNEQNNNSARASRFFVHFFAVPTQLRREMMKF